MNMTEIFLVIFGVMFSYGVVRFLMDEFDSLFFMIVGGIGVLVCSILLAAPKDSDARNMEIEQKKIPVLFSKTNDGCSVYRFVASGRERFFTRCENSSIVETSHTESCGKNCTQEVSIQTEQK